MATNPYFNAPITPARPRMFASTTAKVLWICVPVVTLGLASAVPFVVAAVKGVIKPWLAGTYIAGEIAVFLVALAISPKEDDAGAPFAGFLMVLLIITAATHTALLDSDRISIGK
ncbi:hypothetical protein [Streptomyces shenzhenensis]|uniref:Uncharacterized protein n=1 Tax=Streptomyces shenzhenensis TaxID=943815 RepID=A0A3M0HTL1_9ACTN|nr:hypothetical protein [Streptomyces shenzhenensis]RMB80811.1 hypothetical protein CTZ28_37960 [Streptomyces shenzhenensis]